MGCNHSGLRSDEAEDEKQEDKMKEQRPKEKRRPQSSERKKERKNKQKKKDEKKSKKTTTNQGSSTEKLSFVRRKLDQIRTWISCGRRTIVQTITVDQSSSGIVAIQSGNNESSSYSENFAQFGRSSVRSSAYTAVHNVHVAQSDPLPGRKLIRPKAAKGERPKAKPHPTFSLPGVVQDGYDQDVTSPARSCSVRTTTLNTSSKVKKERPKAAKGQRTVNKVRPNPEPTEKS